MSDFVAALLVLMALAAVGNFADVPAFAPACSGGHGAWVRVCY